MMCSWGVTEEPTIRGKGLKIVLIIYCDFMQSLLYQVLRGGVI